MPRAKRQPGRCKKIAKSTGKRCRHSAADTGYCSQHKPPKGGAQPGNRNSQIHGIYTKSITEEEHALAAELDLLSIDGELLTMKIQYTRVLRVVLLLSGEDLPIEEQVNFDNLIRLYESRVMSGTGEKGEGTDSESTTNRMPDFEALLDRTASRIESLTTLKLRIEERDDLLAQLAELRAQMEEITKAKG